MRLDEERTEPRTTTSVTTTMERVSNDDHPLSSSSSPSPNRYRGRWPDNRSSSYVAQSSYKDNMIYSNPGGPWPQQQLLEEQRSTLPLTPPLPSAQEHYHSPPRNNHHKAHNDLIARSPAASLIQSVARSALLDDATPNSTVISDDASDLSNSGFLRGQSPLSKLQSLQTPTLPALPDKQDRRRFIGCLAVVLASSYDFDDAPDADIISGDINSNTTTSSRNETSVWLGYPDEFWEDDDDNYDLDNNDDEQNVDDTTKLPNSAFLSKTHSTASDSFYSTRCQSFESLGTEESSKKRQQSNRRNRRRRQTESSKSLPPRQSSMFQLGNAKEKQRLARERHRHRRYEILSKFLMNSSELLLLDKMVARAFLPMLSCILVPECRQLQKNDTDASQSSSLLLQPQEPASRSRSAPSSPVQRSAHRTATILNSSFDVERMVASHTKDVKSTREQEALASDSDTSEPRSQPLPPMPMDNENDLKPFLESLTPGAGFRCVALLLLQHLLTSEVGYDARIRHVLKKISVIVLVHDMQGDPVERLYESKQQQDSKRNVTPSKQDMMLRATRKFEALEHSLAQRLIRLSSHSQNSREAKSNSKNGRRRQPHGKGLSNSLTREQIVRGVKIGGAGIVAGTLFALTGGLAAPGIAAGIAAFAGAAAGTAAVATLTSAAVVTTIFGVGGGGLAAYKMQRRTQGVTEFEFYKETGDVTSTLQTNGKEANTSNSGIEAELFSVLCISGWLRDQCDYQRPWGLQPTNPRIQDRQELLERFYSVYSPEHLPKCAKILESWKGEESQLWDVLREKYGCDPDHLFPLSGGPRTKGALTLEQEEILDKLFVELGYNSIAPEQELPEHQTQYSPFHKMRSGWISRKDFQSSNHHVPEKHQLFHSMQETSAVGSNFNSTERVSSSHEAIRGENPQQEEREYKQPKHLDTAWDWKATYGGEMYHVKWESDLLKRICDCFIDLAMDVVSGATKQILAQTVLHTLLAAVVWPSYLLNVANMIDGDWTLAVERADEAGKVLAKTLLFSRAGRRPVTLVGYSFGGRIIYSCLKELARYQEEWETYQEMLEEKDGINFDKARFVKYEAKMKGMREPASIVEDVVLMGLPNHMSLASWRACRQVVAGRLINCYSSKDLILSLMFQAKRFSGGSFNAGMGSILKPVCGTCPVEEPGVENIDCSDLIMGHQDYCMEIGKILERIRFGQPMRSTDSQLTSSETPQ